MTEIKIKEVIRSRRRTVSLIINPDATLTIKAPVFTPMIYINHLIAEKRSWIIKTIREIKAKPKAPKHKYLEGEEFMYLGQTYKLKIGHFPLISLMSTLNFPVSKYSSIREKLSEWYKNQALETLKTRVNFYAKKMGVKYTSVRITQARSRWGSCSHDDHLRFNWKLIMSPLEVMDYVVVHELTHVIHKNHSQRFWIAVRNYIPDCKRRIKWLRDNGNRLDI